MPVTPFPAPRTLTTTPGGAAPDAPLTVNADPELPAQGFQLTTGPDGIAITHRDAAGLRYALQTLDQLRAAEDFTTTGYRIADHPDFETRGFMLDISRDRVPTRATLLRWLDLLSTARFNQLELYTEHTYAFRDHQQVWQNASPLTAEDLRWLDDRCTERGIELVPNQNTFGHMERFLAHSAYSDRAENPDGFDRAGVRRPPSTLEPTAENAAFATSLVAEVAANLRSRRVNIGADEPFELGTGRSRERVEREGLGEVYMEYLDALLRPWLDAGYTVQFWADVFGEYPELMDRVPEGAVPVVWQYDSARLTAQVLDSTPGEAERWRELGVDVDRLRSGFRGRAKLLSDAGVPFWVAPGANNWNSLVGRLDNAEENLIDAAEVGLENAARGYLLTSWGDQGHWDPPSVAFGPVLFGGAVSWCLETNRDTDTAAVLNDHALYDASGLTGSVLDRLGRICEALGVPMLNASPLTRVLLPGVGWPLPAWPGEEALAAVDRTLADCRRDLAAAEPAAADSEVVRRELRQAIGLAEFAVELLRARAAVDGEADTVDPATARRLLRQLDPLLAEQRACWLLRSRPGGLDDSIRRFDALRHQLIRAAQR